MNKIKMSDVFNLPINPWAVTRMWDEDIKLAVIAINAYDANQERIAELKQARDRWINTALESVELNNEDFTIIKKQQERIAELEAALLELIDTASQCDSWESFPSDALDDATAAAIGEAK